MSLRKLRRRVREEAARHRGPPAGRVLPGDVVEFCRGWLGYEPYEYMYPFLRDGRHFIANVQARQTGKTFNGMAKLLFNIPPGTHDDRFWALSLATYAAEQTSPKNPPRAKTI